MATFKYHLRKSKKTNSDEGRLFIRVIHNRQVKDIASHYTIRLSEWDEENGRIVYHIENPSRNDYLSQISDSIRNNLSTLKMLESKWVEEKKEHTCSELVEAFSSAYLNSHTLLAYCERVYFKLIAEGQPRTARAYRSAVRSLVIFRKGKMFNMEEFTASLLRDYEKHLKDTGKSLNTISFYMRNLRALYYRAIEDKIIHPQQENPFTHVYTGVHETRKRALKVKELKSIWKLQDKLGGLLRKETRMRERQKISALHDSIQYFNFCLEARGMSWVDMAFLRKEQIKDGQFTYFRRKTRREMQVMVTPGMQDVIRHFSERTKDSPYVFPIIDPAKGCERRQYESGLRSQNERLEEVTRLAGLSKKVTTHVTRHTWASVAKDEGLEIPVISELLGHRDTKTTRIYLDALNDSALIRHTNRVTQALRKAS